MNSSLLILLVIGALCVNARVVKRQRKITRVLPKSSSSCGCQRPVLELPCPKSLLESAYGCLGTCACPDTYGCQNIFLEELPCRCNECTCIDGYGVVNADVSNYDRVPVIRLPKTLASIDAGIPVAAINLPSLCQCGVPSCQCQNSLPYQILESPCCKPTYEFINPVNVPNPVMKMPVEMIQPVFMEALSSVMKPLNCGCQMPVEVCGCQRQKCGCQLSPLDIPCSCQLPGFGASCGCTLSAFDVPCGCQLPAFNLPCGRQLPGLDCGCQFQAYNSPCSCQVPMSAPCGCQVPVSAPCGCQVPVSASCGCQLPVPNVPYAYQLPPLDVSCGCQLPSCGFQSLPPPVIGCTKYLRQVTLQPPFL